MSADGEIILSDHSFCYHYKAHDRTSYDQWLCEGKRRKCQHEFKSTQDPERDVCKLCLVTKLV